MQENDLGALGKTIEQIDTTDMDGKYLTFVTDHQLFGVPIADVVQIVGMQDITVIPEFPSYAKGVINLRGSIIPLIDVRLRFGKPEIGYDERTCIIVTLIHDVSVGFIVDEVDSVTNIDSGSVSPPPRIASESVGTYISGVARHDNKVVLLLNASKLLSEETVGILNNAENIGGN